jgi:hypothetical protein
MISCMNMITNGMCERLYLAHLEDIRLTVLWLSLSNIIIVWRGSRETLRNHIVLAMERHRPRDERNNTYQPQTIHIYYCIFMIPIPIVIYLRIYQLSVVAALHLR